MSTCEKGKSKSSCTSTGLVCFNNPPPLTKFSRASCDQSTSNSTVSFSVTCDVCLFSRDDFCMHFAAYTALVVSLAIVFCCCCSCLMCYCCRNRRSERRRRPQLLG